MEIYVLVMLSFCLVCWIVALFDAKSNTQAVAILVVIGACILAVVFQSIQLASDTDCSRIEAKEQ